MNNLGLYTLVPLRVVATVRGVSRRLDSDRAAPGLAPTTGQGCERRSARASSGESHDGVGAVGPVHSHRPSQRTVGSCAIRRCLGWRRPGGRSEPLVGTQVAGVGRAVDR